MTTWLDIPLIDVRPNFDDPDLTTGRDLTFSTRGFGQVTAWSIQPNAQRTSGLPFLLIGRPQISSFVDFFNSQSGRVGSFWIPAYQNAMSLKADVAVDDVTLTCGDTGLRDRFTEHPGYRYACLVSPDALQPFKIASVDADPDAGTMTVNVAGTLAQAFQASETVVSWLLLARLQSDELQVVYETDSLATIQLEIIEVPREYPT